MKDFVAGWLMEIFRYCSFKKVKYHRYISLKYST
ncbi:MAG: hypothetical protein ACI93L_003374 [Cyclobacteriaceae bacterium]